MKMKGFIVAILLVLWAGSPLFANDKPGIAMSEAIAIAEKEIGGTVIKAELEDGVYEIKILNDEGEKIKLKIDPAQGTIIRKGMIIKGSSSGFGRYE